MNHCRGEHSTRIRGVRRQQLFTSLFSTLSTANGSASPMAMFAPPSHILVQPRSFLPQRALQFDYRNSYQNSSTKEFAVTDEMSGCKRRNARSIPTIKSPSNSFTQFYKESVLVGIEYTSPNSRRISGEMIIADTPIDNIWNILTDYDNLSSHVPNLMESRVISIGSTPRVYQRGAQRIFGFKFGADVTLDMSEFIHHGQYDNGPKMYSVDFACVKSQFFSEFDGSWILEEYSKNKTMVRYIVDVRPKGPVPVAALEWRIKEDVPVNILAVLKSARASGEAKRQEERQNDLALPDDKSTPRIEPLNRIKPSLSQPQPNPPQQPTNQATRNFKQRAKPFFLTTWISMVRQAIKVVNSSNPMARAPGSRRNIIASASLDAISRKRKSLKYIVKRIGAKTRLWLHT